MTENKYPRAEALAVAERLVDRLKPYCTRILIAGSLRRLKAEVSDVEICYVPRIVSRPEPGALFGTVDVDLAEEQIAGLLKASQLRKRPNDLGAFTWGPQNKLAVDVETGVPVDLFATKEECWFNYTFCRTGSAEMNQKVATMARARGLHWHPYGMGFTDEAGRLLKVEKEEDVFRWIGLPYYEPEDR